MVDRSDRTGLAFLVLRGSPSTWMRIRAARRNLLHRRSNVASKRKFTGAVRPKLCRHWNRNGTFQSKRLQLNCGCPARPVHRLRGGQRNDLYPLDPVARLARSSFQFETPPGFHPA